MNIYMKSILAAAAACLFFVFGWMIGSSTIKNDPIEDNTVVFTESTEQKKTENQITEAEPTEEAVPTYCIISENDSIYLYEIKSGDKNVIASHELETELLPADDVKMLEAGINSDDYNSALRIWEGYVS